MEEKAMTEKEVIEKFYTSFQQLDWRGMQSCYDDAVIFSDPVFQHLEGGQAKAMWHMLASAAKDLKVTFSNVRVEGGRGSCDWEAWYTFSRTGRPVHNRIHAEFEFSNRRIVRHTDTFDLTRWAGMALGLPGVLLGWTPMIKNKIRATASSGLTRFLGSHPEYSGS